MFNVGDYVRIDYMIGEDISRFPMYGIVEFVDDAGQAHGSWGGLALQVEDDYEVIPKDKVYNLAKFCKLINVAMAELGISEDRAIELVNDYLDKNNLLPIELFDKEKDRKLQEKVEKLREIFEEEEDEECTCTDSE